MTRIYALILAAALGAASFQSAGCSAIFSSLPTVLAYVQDGQLVVSAIEGFVNSFFIVRPDAELQKKISVAIARTKAALSAVLRAGTGVEKLNQADVDAAFKEFQLAYTDLVNLVKPLGVSTEGKMLKATPGGGLIVPEPLMIKRAL